MTFASWLLFSIAVTFVDATEILEGRIVGVTDGDTVTLLVNGNQQVKIRFDSLGIVIQRANQERH